MLHRLAFNPVWNERHPHKIFLCKDPALYKVFVDKLKKPTTTQGFHLQPMGSTFVSLSFIESIHQRYGESFGKGILEGSPTHVITHEITHELMANTVGFFTDRNLPSWKKEGYCEYMGTLYAMNEEGSTLASEISKYQAGFYENISEGRKLYIRSRLMIWYLIEVKSLSLYQIIELEKTEEGLWEEVITWSSID